jgi:hypothetical protein
MSGGASDLPQQVTLYTIHHTLYTLYSLPTHTCPHRLDIHCTHTVLTLYSHTLYSHTLYCDMPINNDMPPQLYSLYSLYSLYDMPPQLYSLYSLPTHTCPHSCTHYTHCTHYTTCPNRLHSTPYTIPYTIHCTHCTHIHCTATCLHSCTHYTHCLLIHAPTAVLTILTILTVLTAYSYMPPQVQSIVYPQYYPY